MAYIFKQSGQHTSFILRFHNEGGVKSSIFKFTFEKIEYKRFPLNLNLKIEDLTP